ncbi:hypothetical protein [Microvirga sp. KLBC 81]|uniref:glycoside hydrolase family 113 n=1 Tax=Microvirga sp. KLBC 81 TaxID=1862707 RepID=UPI0014031831|nr:hypothetical protein [Microvirga sp. KLBC 81]
MSTRKKKLSSVFAIHTWAEKAKGDLAGTKTLLPVKRYSTVSVEKDAYMATMTLTKSATTARSTSKVSGVLINGTDGSDTLTGGTGGDTLNGAGGNDTLFGGDNTDRLNGGAGDDLLDGGAGSDIMAGGTGNDTYIVDTTRDSISELASEGIDTVQSSVSLSLGSNIENLTLTGTANLNGTGNSLNNVMIGNAGSNLLQAGGGNDTLDGGSNVTGAIDTLAGGAGDDVYIVRSATDIVREYAGDGNDTVQTALDYTLGANVENLALTGSANLSGTGNELANHMMGNDGANLLQGQAGNDTIVGGAGNDTIGGGTGNDVLTGGAGADLFRFAKAGGQDTITDFDAMQGDLIDLTGTGITGIEQLQIASSGLNYVIGLGDGTTITLANSTAPQANWFKFDPAPPPGGGGGTGESIFTWEGTTLPSYWGGNFQTTGGLSAMDQVKATGANTVTLVPNFFMANQYSNEVKLINLSTDPTKPWLSESDTFAQVRQAVLDATARGLKVVLKPHLETDNRVWRADIAPTDPKAWFASYKAMMVEYAKVAQAAGASMICVGTEMKSMTDPTKVCSDGMTYTQKWVDIISAVRSVFSGQVTYSSTYEEVTKVGFWDAVDNIGVNPYIPLSTSNTPTVDQMVDAWIQPHFNSWIRDTLYQGKSAIEYYKALSDQYGKQVIFTEVGYRSMDGANKDPGLHGGSGTVDYQEQADAYTALYKVMENYGGRWLGGSFLWSYYPYASKQEMTAAGVSELDYTTQWKPANDIITANYSSPDHVTGLIWTGTSGNDKLDGGYHNDTLNGGSGNDTLWGGAGHDILSGGTGVDRFDFGASNGTDTVTDFDMATLGEVISIAKNVNGLSLSTFEELIARTTMSGTDTVIDLGANNSIKLVNVDKTILNANHFLFI